MVAGFLLANRLELIAFLLGVANVALVVRRSMWNYPFGLAMVTLYAVVFFRTRLYSDALLQLFFFVVNVYGWLLWRRAAASEGAIRVLLLSGRARAGWLLAGAGLTVGWGYAMHRLTDASFPFWDAAVAIPSVIAQLLLSRRLVENWVIWIGVDLLAIPLYAAKELWLTAILYGVFLVLASWGLASWWRARPARADVA